MARHKVARRRSSRGSALFTLSLAVTFLAISVVVGYLFFREARGLALGSGLLPDLLGGGSAGGGPVPVPEIEPWQGTDRVNVLVLGIDERENEHGPWRTDTIILLTIDPLTHSAGMLSIPRDLWVPIPGYDEGRINTAHWLGDAYGYPGGGPALAMRTVQYNFGVPIHYYVRLNFSAFEQLVDLIGGIDVCVGQMVGDTCVGEDISDPTYPSSDPNDPYGYDPLYIPGGMTHMNGALALRYARTRHTPGGDFDRAMRQQQVLLAILDRVTRLNLLPQLVTQAGPLWQTMNRSVSTDLSLEQVIALANLATQIPRENIRTAVIDENYTQPWETPDGQQVLVPVRDEIRNLMAEIFTVPSAAGENTQDPATRLRDEAATVMVQNGTTTAGLAQATAEYLQGQGLNVVGFGNADRSDYTNSLIYVYTGKQFTAETIARLLGLPATAIVPVSGSQTAVDIIVILGATYQTPTPTP